MKRPQEATELLLLENSCNTILPILPDDIWTHHIFPKCTTIDLLSHKNVNHWWHKEAYEAIIMMPNNMSDDHNNWINTVTDFRYFPRLDSIVTTRAYSHHKMNKGHLDAIASQIKRLFITRCSHKLEAHTLSLFDNLTSLYLNGLSINFDTSTFCKLFRLRSLFLIESELWDYTWLRYMYNLKHLVLDNAHDTGTDIGFMKGREIDEALGHLSSLNMLVFNNIPTSLSFLQKMKRLSVLNLHHINVIDPIAINRNIRHIANMTFLTHLVMPEIQLESLNLFLSLRQLTCLTIYYINGCYELLDQLHQLTHLRIVFSKGCIKNADFKMVRNLKQIPCHIFIEPTISSGDFTDELTFMGFSWLLNRNINGKRMIKNCHPRCRAVRMIDTIMDDCTTLLILQNIDNYIYNHINMVYLDHVDEISSRTLRWIEEPK